MALTRITSAGISDGVIDVADISDNTITGAKLASDIAISTTGTITTTGTASADIINIYNASTQGRLNVSNNGAEQLEVFPGDVAGKVSLQAFNRSDTTYDSFRYIGLTHEFLISGTEKMRIDSSGNVGIGTSSPDEKIHAESSVATKVKSKTTTSTSLGGFEAWGNSTSYLKIFQFGSSYGGTTFGGVTGNNQALIEAQEVSSLAFTTQGGTPDIIFAPARTARMTIKNGGNVGIGTSSPNEILEVLKSGGAHIRISETSDRYVEITGYAEGTANGSTMTFSTVQNGTSTLTERMRVNSYGRVGIGETNPTGSLHIRARDSDGADVFVVTQSELSNRQSGYKCLDENGNVGLVMKYDNGPNNAIIQNAVNGNISLYLGGTGSANVLDDYEEGTWTPTLGNMNVSGTFSSSGRYVKVGRMVLAYGKFSATTSISFDTSGLLAGLPFAGAVTDQGTVTYERRTYNSAAGGIGIGDFISSRFFFKSSFATTSSNQETTFTAMYEANT